MRALAILAASLLLLSLSVSASSTMDLSPEKQREVNQELRLANSILSATGSEVRDMTEREVSPRGMCNDDSDCGVNELCVTENPGTTFDYCDQNDCLAIGCTPNPAYDCHQAPCDCTVDRASGDADCPLFCTTKAAGATCDLGPGYGSGNCLGHLNGCYCKSDAECSDGNFCNGAERCPLNGGSNLRDCEPGTDPCPNHACSESGNYCNLCAPNGGGTPCPSPGICKVVGSPACSPRAGAYTCNYDNAPDGTICNGGTCQNGLCSECAGPAECSDGVWCNGDELCESNSCVASSSPRCPAGQICIEGDQECIDPDTGPGASDSDDASEPIQTSEISPGLLAVSGVGLAVVIGGAAVAIRSTSHAAAEARATRATDSTTSSVATGWFKSYDASTAYSGSAAYSSANGGVTVVGSKAPSGHSRRRSSGGSHSKGGSRSSTGGKSALTLGIGDDHMRGKTDSLGITNGVKRIGTKSAGKRRGSKSSTGSGRSSSGGGSGRSRSKSKKHKRDRKGSKSSVGSRNSSSGKHRKSSKGSKGSSGRKSGSGGSAGLYHSPGSF